MHDGLAQIVPDQTHAAAVRPGALLQRACSCGQHTHGEGECEECKKKKVQLEREVRGETVGRSFATVPTRSARVTVAPPDDAFEREAEAVAERVVAGSASPATPGGGTGEAAAGARVQRQVSSIGEPGVEDEQYEAEIEEEEPEEEAASDADPELTPDETGRPKLEADASADGRTMPVAIPDTSGVSLAAPVRSLMEHRIGHDFSRVRVHTDALAGHSARALRAHAYTVGSDVYFAPGQYAPDSRTGQRLLAHELAHVVQQGGGSRERVQRQQAKPNKRRTRGDAPRRERESRTGRKRAGNKSGSCNCKSHAVTCASGECKGCAPPKSTVVRSPCCGNESCGTSGASNPKDFIRHIDVNLSTQMLTEHWGAASTTARKAPAYLVSPNPGKTPKGSFTVGLKCGQCHTNQCGDGMGWFTSFHNGLQFGFHNSQAVAKGTHSHGCVRVGGRTGCAEAQHIHDNTASGVTTVCIHTGDECGSRKRKPAGSGGGAWPKPSESAKPPAVSGVEVEPEGAEPGVGAEEAVA